MPLPSHWTPAIPQGAYGPRGSCDEKAKEHGRSQGRPSTAPSLPMCLHCMEHQQKTKPSVKLTSSYCSLLFAAVWRNIIKTTYLPMLSTHLRAESSL